MYFLQEKSSFVLFVRNNNNIIVCVVFYFYTDCYIQIMTLFVVFVSTFPTYKSDHRPRTLSSVIVTMENRIIYISVFYDRDRPSRLVYRLDDLFCKLFARLFVTIKTQLLAVALCNIQSQTKGQFYIFSHTCMPKIGSIV